MDCKPLCHYVPCSDCDHNHPHFLCHWYPSHAGSGTCANCLQSHGHAARGCDQGWRCCVWPADVSDVAGGHPEASSWGWRRGWRLSCHSHRSAMTQSGSRRYWCPQWYHWSHRCWSNCCRQNCNREKRQTINKMHNPAVQIIKHIKSWLWFWKVSSIIINNCK